MVSLKLIILYCLLNCVAISPTFGRRCADDETKLKGFFSPVFSIVDDQGNITTDTIPKYARYLADNEIFGVIIASNLGEGGKLTVSEEKQQITAWMDAAEPLNIEVIVQIGSRPLEDCQELARYAEIESVDAIVVVPDLTYKPATIEQLVFYMENIAEVAQNTPLLYYDDEDFTGVETDIVSFHKSATERIPTYVGLKAETLSNALKVQPLLKPYQRIIMADSINLAVSIFMSFDGYIVGESNFFPKRVVEIVQSGQECNRTKTIRLYDDLLDITNAMKTLGGNVPVLKAAMPMITGFKVGPVKPPQQSLSKNQKAQLKEILISKGVEIISTDDS